MRAQKRCNKKLNKNIPKAIFSYNVMAWRSIQITLNPE